MPSDLEIAVPPPDGSVEPEGYVVVLEHERIHFLDWGGPPEGGSSEGGPGERRPGVQLIHGLGATAWAWTPVARRLRTLTHVVAMDLRGHGLSDAPTSGYEPVQLTEDVLAVAEGSGLLPIAPGEPPTRESATGRVVLAGHGFGAIVAAWTAAALGERCAGLILVDGGWEDLRKTTGVEPDEWLRGLEEPPEIMRSMSAYLADRAGFDLATWDADQERAARACVTEVPAGHLLPSVRPHAQARTVHAMFDYRPAEVLPRVTAPIIALVATDNEQGTRSSALADAQAAIRAAGQQPVRRLSFPGVGHNLMRYRPNDVAAAILSVTMRPATELQGG